MISAPFGGVGCAVGFFVVMADTDINCGGKFQIAGGTDGGIGGHALSDDTVVFKDKGRGGGDRIFGFIGHADFVHDFGAMVQAGHFGLLVVVKVPPDLKWRGKWQVECIDIFIFHGELGDRDNHSLALFEGDMLQSEQEEVF